MSVHGVRVSRNEETRLRDYYSFNPRCSTLAEKGTTKGTKGNTEWQDLSYFVSLSLYLCDFERKKKCASAGGEKAGISDLGSNAFEIYDPLSVSEAQPYAPQLLCFLAASSDDSFTPSLHLPIDPIRRSARLKHEKRKPGSRQSFRYTITDIPHAVYFSVIDASKTDSRPERHLRSRSKRPRFNPRNTAK
eukprot:Hpha_TRINITY_DN16207_c0_g1::TRINITY_DN16207_c0_g1_i1::g.16363::m.16363